MAKVKKKIVIEVEYDNSAVDHPEDWSWNLGVDFDPIAVPVTRRPDVVHARYLGEAE